MLKFYLTTVVIWMIIIRCTILMFKDGIKKKIGVDETKKASLFKRLSTLFIFAAVPFLRLIIEIMIIYMANCTQEDYDELVNKANNK